MVSGANPPSPLEYVPETVDRLGKYHLLALLAHGGMGDVYLGIAGGMAGFSKLLVVKELRREALEDDVAVSMFLDEARVAARLNHPNIVQTIEVGEDGSRRFMAMEYLEGQPMNRVLLRGKKRGVPMPLETHLRVVLDVLAALHYAHGLVEYDGAPLGIVHRDVSPQNVFLTYEGHVKLIDFGVAKTHLASQQTSSGILKGKIRYMAPEQTTAQLVDQRADVFAIGIMLWEALAGQGPWEGAQDIVVLRSLMSGSVPRLRRVRPDLDPDFAAIVDRATSPDPANRYPTALALRDDLERAMTAEGLAATPTRDLGALVTGLFGGDRDELRAIVESQLRAIAAGTGSSRELLSLSGMRHRDSLVPRRDFESTPSSAPTSPPPAPSAPPPSVRASSTASIASSRILLSAAAVALAAVVWVVLPHDHGASAHASLAPLGASSEHAAEVPAPLAPPPSAPEVLVSVVRVSFRASPPSASLFVDDVPVPNPYVAERPRDGVAHRLRAEAPGLSPQTAVATFDADVALDMLLHESLDTRAVHRAGSIHGSPPLPGNGAGPSSFASPRPAVVPAGPSAGHVGPLEIIAPSRPRREVDKANPYPQ